jgi:hypothetical protein
MADGINSDVDLPCSEAAGGVLLGDAVRGGTRKNVAVACVAGGKDTLTV